MEIKLNAGDNLVIPAGCKATVNNGIILIEKIEPEFKKGDFVTNRSGSDNIICIFSAIGDNGGIISFAGSQISRTYISTKEGLGWGFVNEFKLATEEEEQLLISKLHEAGKDWDAEKLEVVDYEWKPNVNEYYYLAGITEHGYNPTRFINTSTHFDEEVFNSKVVFKTTKLCQAFCDQANELLKNAQKF